jgi:hypothetical protein
MDFPQLRRRQHRFRIALVSLHFVRHAKLFQQPQDALRARVVEVVKNDHGDFRKTEGDELQ